MQTFVKSVHLEPPPKFLMGIWIWLTLTVENSHWVASQAGFSQWVVVRENVCFMDLAEMIIEVSMCVL